MLLTDAPLEFELKMQEYYATVGRGLMDFAAEHLTNNGAVIKRRTEGKICFDINPRCLQVQQLKMVERVFVSLLQQSIKELSLNEILDSVRKLFRNNSTNADRLRETVEVVNRSTETENSEATSSKKICNSHTFRVCIKCRGQTRYKVHNEKLSAEISAAIKELSPTFDVDLRSPDFEISISLNDENFFVGIPITRLPISNRPYIKHLGLRSTVCDAVIHLAQINPGDVVFDPFCGASTLLIECLRQHSMIAAIACDVSSSALQSSRENVEHFKDTLAILCDPALFLADASVLPIRCSTIDRIISDPPFGKKHKCEKTTIPSLYSNAAREMARSHVLFDGVFGPAFRVLVHDGVVVLLLRDSENATVMEEALTLSSCLLFARHKISLGETQAVLCAFRKS